MAVRVPPSWRSPTGGARSGGPPAPRPSRSCFASVPPGCLTTLG